MQIVLTYIIVAVALFFVGRGIYRLFRSGRKNGGCGVCCGCGSRTNRKKTYVFGNSPVKSAIEQEKNGK